MGMRHTPLSLFAAVARRGRTPGPPRWPPVIRFFFRIAKYTPVVIPNLEPVKIFTQPGEKASAGMADRLRVIHVAEQFDGGDVTAFHEKAPHEDRPAYPLIILSPNRAFPQPEHVTNFLKRSRAYH